MNYLAHLYLADGDPESLVGSLMGDFAKGAIDSQLAPAVRWGIFVHRKVDVFTDAHALVRQSKRRVRPQFRRYAGILVDLYYDHFLASHWSDYSAVPLDKFAAEVNQAMTVHMASLPARMQRSMAYMIGNDLLLSYRETEGLQRALLGIEGRLKRENKLSDAVLDLELNYQCISDDFSAFFPQLIDYVRRLNRLRA